jgi:hypothetical protein
LFTGTTGPATGDVFGYAAPSGAGKSQLVNQTAFDVAVIEAARAKVEERPYKIVYVFNYEQIKDPMTHVLSYGAKVPRDTVELCFNTHEGVDAFSRGNRYKPYEVKRYGRLIYEAQHGRAAYPPAEYERVSQVRKFTAEEGRLYLVDFGGGLPEMVPYARNFVDGVVEFIEEHQLSIGRPGVAAVFLDYASAMARLHLGRGGRKSDQDTEYNLLIDLSLQVKHKITNPMHCFAMIAQQLAADEAGRAGGTRPDPTRFKGCKAFAENCDFAFVNGKRTEDTDLAIFVQSKVRRGKPQPDQIGHLDGNFCKWSAVSGDYVIAANRIMERSEASKLTGNSSRLVIDQG